MHALLRDHAEMGEWLREMTPFLERALQREEDRDRLRALAICYSHALWRHIDAENSVLYPEGGSVSAGAAFASCPIAR